MVRKFALHAATFVIVASTLAACTYHRTVVEEHPVRGTDTTTVVVPSGGAVVVQPQ